VACRKHAQDDDSVQRRAHYRDVMTVTDRRHLATKRASHAKA